MAKQIELSYEFDPDMDSTINNVLLNYNEFLNDPFNQINLLQDSQEMETKDSFKLDEHKFFVPKEVKGPPMRGNFAGIAKFSVDINAAHTRKKFLYSHILNRIYVDIEKNFSVTLNWDTAKFHGRPMYVRATTVFSDEAQAQERVERCYQHSHKNLNSEVIEKKVIMNVLRSARELSSQDVYYCGDPDSRDSWYSVLVRMAAPAGHAYKFMCKSSCPAGINRRAIDVIFTLEDAAGEVHGRCSVGARVCSCPRRDINRDEGDSGEKRRKRRTPSAPEAPGPHTKIRVLTPAAPAADTPAPPATLDTVVVELPPIQIIGARAAITGLNVMLSMMEQAREARIACGLSVEDLDQRIASIKELIENLKNTNGGGGGVQ